MLSTCHFACSSISPQRDVDWWLKFGPHGPPLRVRCGPAALASHIRHLNVRTFQQAGPLASQMIRYGADYRGNDGMAYAIAFYCQPAQLGNLVQCHNFYNVGELLLIIEEPRIAQIARSLRPSGWLN